MVPTLALGVVHHHTTMEDANLQSRFHLIHFAPRIAMWAPRSLSYQVTSFED
jgi:hypothetical protein